MTTPPPRNETVAARAARIAAALRQHEAEVERRRARRTRHWQEAAEDRDEDGEDECQTHEGRD